MDKEESSLENLKERYAEFEKKYGLPDFDELNADFSVEKLAELETDHLVKEVRRFVSEKFSNYLRFVEAILHPVNAPIFIFSVIKSIDQGDKEKLTDIYKKLAKREVLLLDLDVDGSEEKEAEFVKESFKIWQDIKKEFKGISDTIKKNWDNKFEAESKSYFG
jgi:hypothetical protein